MTFSEVIDIPKFVLCVPLAIKQKQLSRWLICFCCFAVFLFCSYVVFHPVELSFRALLNPAAKFLTHSPFHLMTSIIYALFYKERLKLEKHLYRNQAFPSDGKSSLDGFCHVTFCRWSFPKMVCSLMVSISPILGVCAKAEMTCKTCSECRRRT